MLIRLPPSSLFWTSHSKIFISVTAEPILIAAKYFSAIFSSPYNTMLTQATAHSLRELSAATQLLSVADGRFAHPKMPIQPYAKFLQSALAFCCCAKLFLTHSRQTAVRYALTIRRGSAPICWLQAGAGLPAYRCHCARQASERSAEILFCPGIRSKS